MSSPTPDSHLHEELATRSLSSTIGESFLFTFIVFVGTIGNIAVLLVLYRNNRLRNILSYFVISLAISDIVMLDLCAPFISAALMLGRWTFGHLLCQIQGFLGLWVACASLATLALVAVNRYFHIVKTSKYRNIFTPVKAKVIVVGGWMAALITPLIYKAAGKDFVFQPGKYFCFVEAKFSLLVVPFYCFIGFSMVVLVGCYFSVFRALKAHERTVANNLRTGNTRQAALSLEEIKVTKILFATVVGFFLCWAPFLVIDMVDIFSGTGWALHRGIYYTYTIFGITSSAINPIIYGVMNPSYRRAYMSLFGIRRFGRVGDASTTNANERANHIPKSTATTGDTHSLGQNISSIDLQS